MTPGVAQPPVVERWADVACSLTLYPETSARVVNSVQACLEALREGVQAESKACEFAFSAAGVWVNGELLGQKENPKLLWLRERLFRSDLSGAVFSEDLSAAALLEFTKRLLSLYLRRDLSLPFDELWPEPFAGIVLLERCFDGTFAASAEASGDQDPPMVAAKNRLRVEDLSAVLGRDEGIRAGIEELQSKVIALAGSEANFGAFDLLAEIAALLPAEGLRDHAVAAEMTQRVLGDLRLQLTQAPMPAGSSMPSDEASFRRLLFVIGRSHFSRALVSSQPGRPEAAGVPGAPSAAATPSFTSAARAAENQIPEDLSSVLEQMQVVPDAALRLPDFEDPAEQLGAYLHFLVTYDDPRRLRALETGIARLIPASGEAGIEVLSHYVDPTRSAHDKFASSNVGRVTACLTRCGLRQHLRRLGLLDVDWVSREFPDEFLTYVQGLDLRSAYDVDELDHVCQKIGPQRFRQCADLLHGAAEFLASPVVKALFDVSRVSVVPLVRQIYAQDRTRHAQDFVRFLRATAARGPDQLVLDAAHDPHLLPHAYLSALAEENSAQLAQQRELCVRALVAATEGSLPRLAQHVRLIQLLVHCDSPQTRALLKRLKNERRSLILHKHASAARQAAAAVLRALDSGPRGQRV